MAGLTGEGRGVFAATLAEASAAVGIPLDAAQIDACARYTDLLLTVNEHTNLTRITDPAAVAVKHFADSLTVLAAVPGLSRGSSVVDVGTGAGFPGVVLKIARPDLDVILIDSVAKRLTFLRDVAEALDLTGIALHHLRAEEAGRVPAHRDAYDLVCARAVAPLPTLLEWCGPLARVEGRFVAMKAAGADEELSASRVAAGELKLRLENDRSLTLPPVPSASEEEAAESAGVRRLLVYRKFEATPPRFPRRSAEIKARPLGGGPSPSRA